MTVSTFWGRSGGLEGDLDGGAARRQGSDTTGAIIQRATLGGPELTDFFEDNDLN